ncbi:hypothetical protein AB0P32_35170, partial [Streptomyces sp. NPDC085995]|uniref:hypothetical protein n=1 Tax=Streptomyces sp. NPDC085995 TaxID=3154861 RepID=UPI003442E84A
MSSFIPTPWCAGEGRLPWREQAEARPAVRAPVADHHALGDQRVRPDAVLDHGRGDVLAARG